MRCAIRYSIRVLVLALVFQACSSQPADPGLGSLDVRTLIRVVGTPDTNGFSLSIDGSAPVPLGHLDSLLLDSITAGAHTLVLGDIAAHCVVVSPNPLSVTVLRDSTVTEYFLGTC